MAALVFGKLDTLVFSGTGVKTFYLSGFQRGKTYTFQAYAYNADGTMLNMGSVNNVLVGDVDTFTVEMTLLPFADELKAKIGLKGTILESKACSLSVKSTMVGSTGQPVINFFRFAPGALDTVRIDTLIPINGNYVGQYTDYSIEVCIYLANNEGFYLGTGSVRLYQSTNATLVIPLTKYGTSGSFAKMAINISPYGRLDFSVSLP